MREGEHVDQLICKLSYLCGFKVLCYNFIQTLLKLVKLYVVGSRNVCEVRCESTRFAYPPVRTRRRRVPDLPEIARIGKAPRRHESSHDASHTRPAPAAPPPVAQTESLSLGLATASSNTVVRIPLQRPLLRLTAGA